MKNITTLLTILFVAGFLNATKVYSQDEPVLTKNEKAQGDSLQSVYRDEESKLKAEHDDKERMAQYKKERKETKAKAKESNRIAREADAAARESKSALRIEKKAQRSRIQADKQAKKAERARAKSDGNE